MQRNNRMPIFPILFFFILLNAIFISGKSFLENRGFDVLALIFGNLILFAATVLSFLSAKRGLTAKNPHAFVRSIYVSIMLKLVICLIAAVIYIFLFRKNLNRPALFTCMGLYLVYTFIEVSVLTKMLKERKNA